MSLAKAQWVVAYPRRRLYRLGLITLAAMGLISLSPSQTVTKLGILACLFFLVPPWLGLLRLVSPRSRRIELSEQTLSLPPIWGNEQISLPIYYVNIDVPWTGEVMVNSTEVRWLDLGGQLLKLRALVGVSIDDVAPELSILYEAR